MKDRSEEDEVADININTVNKYYGDVHVIKDVSLDIKSQSFTVLVGPSGCGKSTMLRMIAGLEDINSGTISIDGQVVNDLPPKQRNKMVFQSYALYPHMTVFIIWLWIKIRKRSKDEINERNNKACSSDRRLSSKKTKTTFRRSKTMLQLKSNHKKAKSFLV